MSLIREPLHVDFYVDPKPLSETEKNLIQNFIKKDKEKRLKKIIFDKAKNKNKQVVTST